MGSVMPEELPPTGVPYVVLAEKLEQGFVRLPLLVPGIFERRAADNTRGRGIRLSQSHPQTTHHHEPPPVAPHATSAPQPGAATADPLVAAPLDPDDAIHS